MSPYYTTRKKKLGQGILKSQDMKSQDMKSQQFSVSGGIERDI